MTEHTVRSFSQDLEELTGDLARKKLMPAVYDLANRGLLPPGFALIGFARRDWADQDFAQIVHDSVREHARTEFREDVWQELCRGIRFVAGDFADDAAFDTLVETVLDLDRVRGTQGNHAFYLSIPPGLFPVVLEHLKTSGLAEDLPHAWRRVVIEKPFGRDIGAMVTRTYEIASEVGALVDFIYWEVFDNEEYSPGVPRGFYVVKPDGTTSAAGTALEALL